MNIAFVVGAPRSGTSILGELIASHPASAIWEIAGHGASGSHRLTAQHATSQVKRAIRNWFEQQKGEARLLVEKNPRSSVRIPFVREVFPEAKIIHIVRDGRDVACSMVPGCGGDHWSHVKPPSWQRLFREYRGVLRCALAWRETVGIALQDLAGVPHMRLRYEELVQDSWEVARQVLWYLDLSEHPAVREFCCRIQDRTAGSYHAANQVAWYRDDHSRRIGRYRENLSAEEQRQIERELSPLLLQLGNDLGQAEQSTPVCITGMHRSGTSMVARLLNLCGLYLGPQQRMIPARADNQAGFWENVDLVLLNERLLAQFGGGWDLPPVLPEGWEAEASLAGFRQKALELAQPFRSHAPWGWKDPRCSLTMRFWQALFPGLRAVVCLRNPLEVALSLRERNGTSIPFGLHLWLTYNGRLLDNTRPEERVVTHYDVYFRDPRAELERVLQHLGIVASEEAVDQACRTVSSQLRHSAYSRADLLRAGATAEVVELYEELCAEAGPVYGRAVSAASEAAIAKVPERALTSIIILTHNGLEHTRRCLASIEDNTPEPHELIIVDNGSTDGTVEYLRDYANKHEQVRVIANSTNRGFAAGNNQGLALARGEHVLLLNNDTVVTEGWLGRMLALLDRYPEVGLVGPVSNYVSGAQLVPKVPYRNGQEMHRFARQWAREHAGESQEVTRLVGFCLLMRRSVIERVGGLDERFGSGNFEDDDFCLRAAIAGFRARIARDAFVHHEGSQTFKEAGIDYRANMQRNWRLFKAKWGISEDLPLGRPYTVTVHSGDVSRLYVELPDVAADHTPDEGQCWWQDSAAEARRALDELLARVEQAQAREDWKTAIECLQGGLNLVIADSPTKAGLLNRLGYCQFMAGDHEAAEKSFVEGLELTPDHVGLLNNIAELYLAQEQYDRATEHLNRALAVDPNDVNVLMSLGRCSIELGALDVALMAYRRVQTLAPETEGVAEVVNELEGLQAVKPATAGG